MGLKKFMDATLEDIAANPNAFGAPTLEQFMANPDRWRKPTNQILDIASKGSSFNDIVRHVYYVEGYKCKNEEEVERVILSQGYTPDDFTIDVHAQKTTNGKREAIVRFVRNKGVDVKT